MLGGQADLEVVGEAGDGLEGVAARRRAAPRRRADGHPDAAAATDWRRPARLHARPDAAARSIVLTTFDADEHVVRGAGAPARDGFLLKDTAAAEIVEAIRKRRRRRADALPRRHPTLIGARRATTGDRPTRPRRAARGSAGAHRPRARGRRWPSAAGSANAEIAARALPVGADRQGARVARSSTSSTSPTACRSRSASTTPPSPDRRDNSPSRKPGAPRNDRSENHHNSTDATSPASLPKHHNDPPRQSRVAPRAERATTLPLPSLPCGSPDASSPPAADLTTTV